MRKFLLASAAAITLSTGALAADLPVRGPAIAPAPIFVAVNWGGFYAGVNAGYAFGSSRSSNLPGLGNGDGFNGGAGATQGGISTSPGGFVGGVQLGYNYQMNNIVLGVEGELGYLGLQKTNNVGAGEANPNGQGEASVRYGAFGTLTGRLGFTFDRALLYVKGGAAFAEIRNRAGDFDGGVVNLTDLSVKSGTRFGWVLGAGIEYAFNNNWRGRLEYQYMDFQRPRSTNQDGDFFRHRNNVQMVRVGLNYYFGGPAGAVVAKY